MQKYFQTTVQFILVWMLGHSDLMAQQISNEFEKVEIYVKLKTKSTILHDGLFDGNVNVELELPAIKKAINVLGNKILSAKMPFYFSRNEKLKKVYKIKVAEDANLAEMINALKAIDEVELVEPVRKRYVIDVTVQPTDSLAGSQWFLHKVGAPEAWSQNPGKQDVVVAVVDNAVQVTHVDLAANIVQGRDVADSDDDPNPPNDSFSHGTHVAGIVGAVTNNALGIASAGNNRVKIMPIKAAYNTSSNRSIDAGYEGLVWAYEHGADIVNMSWGGEGYSQIEQDVINAAYASGALLVAAAGNEENDIPQYPASYEHVISVVAVDSTDQLSSFSSFGEFVDISSPGRRILSTIPTDNYLNLNGTSMATPLVAACAGYLLSCYPTLSPDSLEYILKKTTDDIAALNPTYRGQMGVGRINLQKAVACKDAGLFNAYPQALPRKFYCAEDSVQLHVQVAGSEHFRWLLNNAVQSTAPSFYTKKEGEFILERSANHCVLRSDPLKLVHNQSFSPSVQQLASIDAAYCEPKTVQLTAKPSCGPYGPKTFTYTGPVVGFDGFYKSGDYPSVYVSGLGDLIDSVTVSISWQKKDGGDYTTCEAADFGQAPFNEEVSFKLLSPEGVLIPLLNEKTYQKGSKTSGVVTTVFTAHGSPVPKGSLPVSGSFKAEGDLGQLKDMVSQGTWTLIASDSYLIDPLCVSGFAVTVKSKDPVNQQVVNWFGSNTSTTTLATGATLSLSSPPVGINSYYVAARCEGMCSGPRQKAEVRIRPVPELFAFSRSIVLLSSAQIDEVMHARSVDYSVANNLYTVFGVNQSGNSFSYKLSDRAPLISPVSLCPGEDFVLFGRHCRGQINWSNGQTGPGMLLQNLTNPLSISASCQQTWNCNPLGSFSFDFEAPGSALDLKGILDANSTQTFYGDGLTSTHKIRPAAKIEYRAPSYIVLKPGFSSENASIFKAEIRNCQSN